MSNDRIIAYEIGRRHRISLAPAILVGMLVVTAAEPAEPLAPPVDASLIFAGLDEGTWDLWHRQGETLSRLTRGRDVTSPAVAADGRIAFADAAGTIRVLDRAGGLTELTDAPAPCNHPAWSPDGRQLVFACFRFSNRQDDGALWLADLDSGRTRLLYDGPGLQKSPAWSPDGHTLAFVSGFRLTPTRVVETIWTLDIHSGKTEQIIDADSAAVQPSWSPDGRQLAYASDRSGNMEIWRQALAGGPPVRLTDHPAFDGEPAWSPDGREIAFVSTRGGELEIWQVPVQGGPARRWIEAGQGGPDSLKNPAWSRGGAEP